jgi:hypothetical protein
VAPRHRHLQHYKGFISQNRYGIKTRYDMCKELQVANPNVQAALDAIVQTEGRDYNPL